MLRAILVPPDIPENYTEIIVVFAEVDSHRGKSGAVVHAADAILKNLEKMPLAQRVRVIKQICSGIEDMLLQCSKSPDDLKVREITGNTPHAC